MPAPTIPIFQFFMVLSMLLFQNANQIPPNMSKPYFPVTFALAGKTN
jgi:hypothetical protein